MKMLFGELCVDDCFLPASVVKNMSIHDLITIQKSNRFFTKTDLLTLGANGSEITTNAKFNGNGNREFFEDNEPIIQIFIPLRLFF